MANIHSVTLNKDKCMGCTNCLKRCPTEAIRVRGGKAVILSGRCIDCGECIRVCPHHAKQAIYDTIEVISKYEYSIALPAPSLYAQFARLDGIDRLLSALPLLGFDKVFEVSAAAELVTAETVKYIKSGKGERPVISSACPTISRLIQIRFPELIGYILPLITPAELAAGIAKKLAMDETGLPAEKIGAIFISPCPAKVSTILNPIGRAKSNLDAAIAIKDIYPLLIEAVKGNSDTGVCGIAGPDGVRWGSSGGEATASGEDRYLAADGIENCIRVLEKLEDGKIDVDFVELNACPGGCVGGVLTIENPFIAKARLKRLLQDLPSEGEARKPARDIVSAMWEEPIGYMPVMELDSDIGTAMKKMSEIDAISQTLRGLDCGSCGAPSCRAFAEDIVQGECTKDDCIFVLRESMQNIAEELFKLSSGVKNS